MTFQEYVKLIPQEIETELKIYLAKWRIEVEETNPNLLPLTDLFIDACDGGKRLRGALVKLGFELSGNKYEPEILKSAVAIEIFQTAILAQDDIVDQSPTRRGKKTIHTALGNDHYAISQTMMLGDTGFFLALKLIGESKFAPERVNKALQSFSETMLKTAIGEMLDIELSQKDVE